MVGFNRGQIAPVRESRDKESGLFLKVMDEPLEGCEQDRDMIKRNFPSGW